MIHRPDETDIFGTFDLLAVSDGYVARKPVHLVQVKSNQSDRIPACCSPSLTAKLRAECGCRGWVHREWCAHVASLWWRWVRGRVAWLL